jgi:hypothetical protein
MGRQRVIADLMGKEEWYSLDTHLKGEVYEVLLQENAEDVEGGAGSPRARSSRRSWR